MVRGPAAGPRPTALTLGSIIRPRHRQAGEQIRHPRPKGHHPDYDLLWPAGRSDLGKSRQTGLNFWGRRSESQQEVGHVRRARSRPTKEEIQTAAGQPRRWIVLMKRNPIPIAIGILLVLLSPSVLYLPIKANEDLSITPIRGGHISAVGRQLRGMMLMGLVGGVLIWLGASGLWDSGKSRKSADKKE